MRVPLFCDQFVFDEFFFGFAARAFGKRFGFEVCFQLGFGEEFRQFDGHAVERREVRAAGTHGFTGFRYEVVDQAFDRNVTGAFFFGEGPRVDRGLLKPDFAFFAFRIRGREQACRREWRRTGPT